MLVLIPSPKFRDLAAKLVFAGRVYRITYKVNQLVQPKLRAAADGSTIFTASLTNKLTITSLLRSLENMVVTR